MTIATLAHGARQSLARGLEALQAVDAPPALLDVAQPVARAMGVLAEIETAPDGMVASRVEPALEALREGLRLLQLPQHVEHPAAARGMAAVAETLGVVVELVRSLEGGAAPLRQQPFRREDGLAEPVRGRLPKHPASQTLAAAAATAEPVAITRGGGARSEIVREVLRDRDLRTIDAALGTSSPSNFYTGLAGGEVIAAGGLFVATYQIPKLGETVLLEVSLPGGYEFLARAVVAWTRSAGDTSGSMRAAAGPPGFGARFAEITEEGCRLIERYVKNREPLFHDD